MATSGTADTEPGTAMSETRMLTDEEIDEGASDIPLGESQPSEPIARS